MMPALQNLMVFYVLTCLRQNALGSEIINGKDVPAKLMLYMASVQHNNRHRCGGFLVSEDFVVTAAHCDHGDALSVVLGTHNLKNVDDSTMRYSVTKCKHPDYKKPATGNDIMLLKLSKKVQLNNRVQPIQLPNSAIKDKAKCRVAGWGFTKTRGTTVSVLKKVDLTKIKDFVMGILVAHWCAAEPQLASCLLTTETTATTQTYPTSTQTCQNTWSGSKISPDRDIVKCCICNYFCVCSPCKIKLYFQFYPFLFLDMIICIRVYLT
ncbi:granzyme B(G,H)-like isoform X1 [Parambassis ranga]|uniref:trypsin n=1 Tax=Parambassis ranga TaxID=210632 RepID=A0A6P7IEU5_9TELE|nr:granzyme B(G,H)-like isoform X1 [Parambassis ranga]